METEREALADLIAEAHTVMKDLNVLLRQCRLATEILETRARTAIDEEISAIVQEALDEYGETMKVAISEATASVYARFEQISAVLLNETKAATRRGDTLEEQAALVRKIIEDRGYG